MVGIASSNFHAALNGNRTVTIEWINKLLSGIGHEATCLQEIVIQEIETGPTVETVHYGELGDELLLEGIATTEIIEHTSSLSEKLQEKSKTPEESLSQDHQVES